MSGFYEINIAGLTRKLPLCPVSDKLDIGAFIMFSDVEITVKSAEVLLEKVSNFDIIVTAESKGIPLAYEMSRQCGKNYIVARKSVKVYMTNPVSVSVKSITTETVQTLYLGENDAEIIKGKKILIADDVISTGESLKALEELITKAGGIVTGKCAVLAEGDACDRNDIVYIQKLPLFFK